MRRRACKQVGEASDGVERAAQIVRDGVGEGFELTVGGAQFGSPLLNALLKLVARFSQSGFALLNLLQHVVEGLGKHRHFNAVGGLFGAD